MSSFNDPETRNGFYKSDEDDQEEFFRKFHNKTREPGLKYRLREGKRLVEEEAAEKVKEEESK